MPATEDKQQEGGQGSAASHLLAFALGAVSVGAALLVRTLTKKLRRRRRVVSAGRGRPPPAASRPAMEAAQLDLACISMPHMPRHGGPTPPTALPPPAPPPLPAPPCYRALPACSLYYRQSQWKQQA